MLMAIAYPYTHTNYMMDIIPAVYALVLAAHSLVSVWHHRISYDMIS